MFKYSLFLLGYLTYLSLYSCSSINVQKAGAYNFRKFFINITDSTKLPLPLPNMESKIWLKDSFLIIEIKSINSVYSNDSLKNISYDFFKYTFLNLRTRSCQDYLEFSDTAVPITNYSLADKEFVGWDFWEIKDRLGIADKAIKIADTTIENKIYKRLKTFEFPYNPSSSFVYYLDCNSKLNLFHFSKQIDNLFPKCQVVMTELSDNNTGLKYFTQIVLLNGKLSAKESAIFNKWKINSITNSLPLLTLKMANKIIDEKYLKLQLDTLQNR